MWNKKLVSVVVLATAALSSTAAMADDRGLNTVAGAVVGAAIGNSAGGRDGAIVGGVLGAAVGNSISTGDRYHRGGYVETRVYTQPTPVYYAPPPPPVYYTPAPRVVYVEPRPYYHDHYWREREREREYREERWEHRHWR
jgi:hypothetical protein